MFAHLQDQTIWMFPGFPTNFQEPRGEQKRQQQFLEFARYLGSPSNNDLFMGACMDSGSNILPGMERTQAEKVFAPLMKAS